MIDQNNAEKTVHFGQALLATGWAEKVRVAISGGLIATITVDVEAQGNDDRHAIGLPGMSNVHSHAFQRGMAGLAEVRGPGSDSFWTWRDIMYRFVDRIDPDGLRAIAALAYAEMLEAGFTRVGEFHYLHRDPAGVAYANPAELSHAIIAAAADTGIGLTHLPVFYAHSGFGGTAPRHAQRRFVHDLDGFARLLDAVRAGTAALPDAIVGIAPHSLRAVTADELGHLQTLAGTGPIHIHLAEQLKEVEDCVAWSGQRPVEWLMDHANIDARWCLVHATHMTGEETVALAQSGAVVGLCPITEANLGDGLFPAVTYQAAGGRFGIGTDSNVLIDMSEEMRLLEYGQRLLARARNIMTAAPGQSTGQEMFDAAVRGGAQALGVAGGLAVGHAADMISLDSSHVSLVERKGAQIMDSFLFAAGRSAIDGVWRRGTMVVRSGKHVARDAISDRYRRALQLLVA
ncbi:formimidoylglutamate deiminase [Sphingopyxis bauzanensis]|uniref:Formimidoylglutamate deiminase n=1 Tax=Sphingopyxis bauzanensis TaxID=651663 RepID=A0A246JP21_9SPHN|nr:formimidoylglutamate deiminase [Sphingopyxis bauzanensis]OWQ94496.1 formimidoylglutamate deiminase [Sphingopyxis bauzanensis]GGJ54383.1 N-formimino-L-glutamate deiminase [Sphingopyxis bauzanensis]